ncbi:Phospholipase D/Transphosphatidylase [Synechococcus sp. BL107]|uniref:phospholipase D-like domain-containing protein n=1 Tax=Synechococcus sp. BL107 TaxID=313625 RepID=UPI0000E544C8|nr:phospholipase D-like domain-containing protein [Synechococcus sp. BL107]EAU72570.1 Phospholipase D/Transphosphatidylase [Synechococcus sp. BL107]
MISPDVLKLSQLLLGLAVLCGCSQRGMLIGAASIKQLNVPDAIAVGFNHHQHNRYQSPITGGWRDGDDIEQILVQAIELAQYEILLAVQELSTPTIADALIAAKRRGVTVQVILENNYSTPWTEQTPSQLKPHQRQRWYQLEQLADQNGDGITTSEEAQQGDAIGLLRGHRIPILDDTDDGSRGSGLMHHKFVVIDRMVVLTGSTNFTRSGMHGDANRIKTRGNVNHILRFKSHALAELFRQEFETMWGDGPGGKMDSRFGLQKESAGVRTAMVGATRVDVLFAPHRKRDLNHGLNWIEQQLDEAGKTIDMALFVFTAQQLADALQRRVNAGLQIRLIADPSFASRSFSEVLDLLGVALPDRNCKLEQDNQPFNKGLKGVGTPRLARGDKLHHKFAVIDNHKVITGSFNWSPSAAHTNDETLLVIHSPKLAAHFTREMDRLWDTAELGITPHIQRKLDRQRIRCGDGVERE